MSQGAQSDDHDRRFMAAALRLSRRHLGLTGTNPSVGILIVADGTIVGRGVTALGGRPHAEPQALAEAGERAHGATAYVTLEPCAHHGRTPPCAEALIDAGVTRVVGAASDPDPRVAGRGYVLLRDAGVEVSENVLAQQAADLLLGYLTRSSQRRPEVTLKLALSADGKLGRTGTEVAITGEISRRQVHVLRAEHDAILVGSGTVLADDPDLTVRLPGLERRSPQRIVLDQRGRVSVESRLAITARNVPFLLAVDAAQLPMQVRNSMQERGVELLATDIAGRSFALPELLEDLAARGISTLLVEGGAETAKRFLEENLVDRILLFQSATAIGLGGIPSPLDPERMPAEFRLLRQSSFGRDQSTEWVRR